MPAHNTVSAIQEHRVDFLAEAYLADVLIVLLLDLEDLRQLLYLLLQSADLLLHLHFLRVAHGCGCSRRISTVFFVIDLALVARVS